MADSAFNNGNGKDREDYHLFTLFATERIEDYIVLSLALIILIMILFFY